MSPGEIWKLKHKFAEEKNKIEEEVDYDVLWFPLVKIHKFLEEEEIGMGILIREVNPETMQTTNRSDWLLCSEFLEVYEKVYE